MKLPLIFFLLDVCYKVASHTVVFYQAWLHKGKTALLSPLPCADLKQELKASNTVVVA